MATSSQTASRVADLAPVTEALSGLVAEFAELPRPYVYLFTTRPVIGIQVSDPSHFELWREALVVSAAEVTLNASEQGGSAWLDASGHYRGVEIILTGYGVPLSWEQVEAPRGVQVAAA
jgi:hypothetical protein